MSRFRLDFVATKGFLEEFTDPYFQLLVATGTVFG